MCLCQVKAHNSYKALRETELSKSDIRWIWEPNGGLVLVFINKRGIYSHFRIPKVKSLNKLGGIQFSKW